MSESIGRPCPQYFSGSNKRSHAAIPLGAHPQPVISPGPVGGEEASSVLERPLVFPDILRVDLSPVAFLCRKRNSGDTATRSGGPRLHQDSLGAGPSRTIRVAAVPI